MEPTTNLNEAVDNLRSRRALLAGVVGGVGAWLVSAAQRAMPADASAGDPLLAGRTNSGGGFSTELRANTTKPTFRAIQLGGGAGIRAEATTGRAVMATAGGQGTGVWAYSPNHIGVHARSAHGWAVLAEGPGPDSYALITSGRSHFGGNVVVQGGVALTEEISSALPKVDQARLFARDNGAGRTQLCVQFHSGDVQVLATQP